MSTPFIFYWRCCLSMYSYFLPYLFSIAPTSPGLSARLNNTQIRYGDSQCSIRSRKPNWQRSFTRDTLHLPHFLWVSSWSYLERRTNDPLLWTTSNRQWLTSCLACDCSAAFISKKQWAVIVQVPGHAYQWMMNAGQVACHWSCDELTGGISGREVIHRVKVSLHTYDWWSAGNTDIFSSHAFNGAIQSTLFDWGPASVKQTQWYADTRKQTYTFTQGSFRNPQTDRLFLS